jgi:beta-phosphoglucomutase
MIKAIFFDLDGILVDLCDLHFETLNLALQEVVGFELSYSEHITVFDGLSTRQKLEKLVEVGRVENSTSVLDCIYGEKQLLTQQYIKEQTKPDPTKIEMCRYLRRDGYRLACVSNCIEASVYSFLECAQLITYFDFYVSNEDVAHPKPHPDPYLLALEKGSWKPYEALAVEDNVRGCASARSAQVPVVKLFYPQVNYLTVKRFIVEISKRGIR